MEAEYNAVGKRSNAGINGIESVKGRIKNSAFCNKWSTIVINNWKKSIDIC